MKKLLLAFLVSTLGISSSWGGTVVFNTDLTDPAPLAAWDYIVEKFENHL